jgi:hypothetical protein
VNAPLITIALVVLIVWLMLAYRGRRSRSERLCRLFKLDPDEYELVGSDLGGSKKKIFLRADGIVGVPDAVFRHRSDKSIVVGEAKRRRYRGALTDYERYQATLYLGLAHRKYRADVRGVMRYGCGRTFEVEPDALLYRELVARVPEYRRVARKFRIH